jgi:hypothetical protein
MAWQELGYLKGWTAYWESYDHRMYAKEQSTFGSTHHFHERPKDLEMAWAVFRSWVNYR